jgi:hypothetical protein
MNIGGAGTTQNTLDAIVVGSGISGGWAAKELTEKGLRTLLLERGRHVKHGDYPTAMMEAWEFPGRNRRSNLELERQAKQNRTGYTTHWPRRTGSWMTSIIPTLRINPSTGCAVTTSGAARCSGSGSLTVSASRISRPTRAMAWASTGRSATGISARGTTSPSVSPASAAGGRFFPLLREYTLLGYFTSERVGREVLHYDPVPGRWDPCVPLAEVGDRLWTR